MKRQADRPTLPGLGSLKDLKTVKQLCADYPGLFTEGSLRWLIFMNPNGFDACTIRLGRRLLIDEQALCRWLEKYRGRALSSQ